MPASQSLDTDSDGLIEVSNLEQLNAVRFDLDGNGIPDGAGDKAYASAFPAAGSNPCSGCNGYELTRRLIFKISKAIRPAW